MQTSVLLSIKPEYAQRIFDGSKRYEFRRKLFSNREVTRVIVYVSSPVKKVIGEFEIVEIIKMGIGPLWERTHPYSGISKKAFEAYFSGLSAGYAISIGSTVTYHTPLELAAHFQVKSAPQSFVYVSSLKD